MTVCSFAAGLPMTLRVPQQPICTFFFTRGSSISWAGPPEGSSQLLTWGYRAARPCCSFCRRAASSWVAPSSCPREDASSACASRCLASACAQR